LAQYGLAVEYARQALSVEPALEPARRLLIQCLLETGHLDNAMCQYRTCVAELAGAKIAPRPSNPGCFTNACWKTLVWLNSLFRGIFT